jgi:cytochrome o ubiquinol oxidase subunit 3
MELFEFRELIADGHGPAASAFLSAFFTLVGTHGLHITIGLIWAGVLLWALYRQGKNEDLTRKFGLFSIYWHFLDVVWIFIFTIVYALGVA